jgi:hypothetical protein
VPEVLRTIETKRKDIIKHIRNSKASSQSLLDWARLEVEDVKDWTAPLLMGYAKQ